MTNLSTLIMIIAAIALLALVIRIIKLPIKLAFKFFIHAAAGFALLLVVNFFGGMLGLSLEISWLSCAVAGILGAPGIIILFVFTYFL